MDVREWVDDRNDTWAAGLRRVSLVAELEVDDDDAERAIRTLGAVLRRNVASSIAIHHPAFLLVALTYAGMTSWEEGTFYAKVAASMGCTKDAVEDATKAFHKCLDKFDLPKFDEAGGMRWVTPVLLHGGIPLDHLDELLDLLTARRHRDASLSGESFVEWVRLNPRTVETQPKALVRFLHYGGDFAPDLVGRVIDLVDGQDAILPRRVRERLDALIAEGRVTKPTGRREARPTFAVLDTGSLILRLPGVRLSGPEREVRWSVRQGGTVESVAATVPWIAGAQVTDAVSVEVVAPVRDVTVERDGSATVLPLVRSEDPLLVFDADGELVPTTRPIPAGAVTVMWPAGSDQPPLGRDGTRWLGDDVDVPYGWDGWTQRQGTVSTGEILRWNQGPAHRVAGADKARVVTGERKPWVQTLDGFDVTGDLPTVQLPMAAEPGDWVVQVSNRGGDLLERQIPATHSVHLLSHRRGLVAADLVVSVKGPLGRGVERRVVVAERLDVECSPVYRPLAPYGGLVEGETVVRQDGVQLGRWNLGASQRTAEVEVDGLQLVVTPPHTSLSWVNRGIPGPWTVEPVVISSDHIAEGTLRVDGLAEGPPPHLVFASGFMRQELLPKRARRASCEFNLASLRDAVNQAGSGTLILAGSADEARVATVRPKRLAEWADIEHGRLRVGATVSEPLELVVHRLAAPWEPARVLRCDSDSVDLPSGLRDCGPLRVLVRRVDEWVAATPSGLPVKGTDIFDVDQRWDASLESPSNRWVCGKLVGAHLDEEPEVTPWTIDCAVEAMAASALPVIDAVRLAVGDVLRFNPKVSLEGLSATSASTAKVTYALVASGLVSAPAEAMDRPDLVEALLSRSPLAAALAASAAVRRHGVATPAAALLASELGEPLFDLWGGHFDDAAVGRFEPEFERKPELPRIFYDYLAPVPKVLLDDDSRTAACYQMWQLRRSLAGPAESALPQINVARRVLDKHGVDLWPLIQARLSHDGVIALPALSIAFALVARLAAYQEGLARRFTDDRRRIFGTLALYAPDLVAIDLIRADAAVIGALR